MRLAKNLRKKYDKEKVLTIDIFDSKKAPQYRGNPNYPLEEFNKHYLVNIFKNELIE